MPSLYVDTSNKLFLGILDDKFSLIRKHQSEEKKNSALLHKTIFDLLKEEGLEPSSIDSLFIAAGPGSYTGIRLGEGLGQILEWQEIPVFSFYHFDVPMILGKEKGIWFSQAFKGEAFFHEWDSEKHTNGLMKLDNFIAYVKENSESPLFGIGDIEHDELTEFTNTITMIEKNCAKFFEYVFKNKMRKPPYYYRPEEVEFKPTQKG